MYIYGWFISYLLAFTRTIALAVDGVAARLADGLLAVDALPAIQAELLTLGAAGVVTELIVPRTAEGRAGRVVVGNGALHPDTVGDPRVPPDVVQRLPLRRRQYHARV